MVNHFIVVILISFDKNILQHIEMGSYHEVKKMLEEKYGKLIILKPYTDDNGVVDNKQQKYIKQITDISAEEGLRLAYGTKYGLHQHYIKLFIAGTKDFPTDRINDLKLHFNDTLKSNQEGS